jgi:putative transposase
LRACATRRLLSSRVAEHYLAVHTRRRLPHVYSPGQWLFITFCLYGAIPPARQQPPHKLESGLAFAWMDRYLDTIRSGPMFLARDVVARVVLDSLITGGELHHYEFGPFVIMPNHVHVLLLPEVSPSHLLKSLKGATAREANRQLGRTGQSFWQRESYDHTVRNAEEWQRIARYIKNNPVRAGLATTPMEYRWSSANPGVRTIVTP